MYMYIHVHWTTHNHKDLYHLKRMRIYVMISFSGPRWFGNTLLVPTGVQGGSEGLNHRSGSLCCVEVLFGQTGMAWERGTPPSP